MSLNQSLNISLGSMKNNQYALTVVSQNIANMNVEGYAKQRVNFQTNEYTTNCKDVISTIKGMNGASIASLSDYIDDGAFRNKVNSNSDAQYYNTLADALSGLEDIADELGDNGLNALLNDFYTASANLEQFPSDYSIRLQYAQAAQNVCDKFNTISKKYDSIITDKEQTVKDEVGQINGLLNQLAQANAAHVKNNQSSATQSQINSIIEKLSDYIDITTDTNDNGSVNLYIGDVAVVQGAEMKYELNANFDSTATPPASLLLRSTENPEYYRATGITDSIKAGALKANIDFINGSKDGSFTSVSEMKDQLNSAAKAFGEALNEIQLYDNGDIFAASITTDANGELILEKATQPFITSTDGGDFNAFNIKVNPEIIRNPYYISAARIDLNNYKDDQGNIDPNWIKSIGNSDNATEFTALQNKKICSLGDGQNNATLSQYLSSMAAKYGNEIANVASKAGVYQDIAESSANNYANLIGVNLNEELADMLKYQRAFEASARLISTIDSLMSTIIGMV